MLCCCFCFTNLTPLTLHIPQGLLDLDQLANACGVQKPLSAALLAQQQEKDLQGIKTFNRLESWGLAGKRRREGGGQRE